jgi:hypothetical protein
MFVNVIEAYIRLYLPWSIAFPVLLFLALLSIYWGYNKADIEERLKHHKTTVNRILIVFLILSGIVIVFEVGVYVGSYGEKLEIVQKNSLQVAYNCDFEDTRDQSWGAFPDKTEHILNFSTNSAHSGIHSVKLDVDIEPFETIWFFGEEIKIVPGVWTQIFLDVFFRTDSENCTVRWDETSDQVYVTVWSDNEYSGPIYFDNITIYGSS